jgi:hypothetical protein
MFETAVRLCLVIVYETSSEHYTVQFDGRSMALESGRYMETVGMLLLSLRPPVCYLSVH